MTNDICPLNMIPLKLSETKSVKFERASQTSIFYKYLYTEEFKEATVVKKKKKKNVEESVIKFQPAF